MKNPSKMETRETKGRKLQTETVFRPRDERSPFICHLSFAFDSPVSLPPYCFPARGQFCPRRGSRRKDEGAGSRSWSRILARKSLQHAEAFRPVQPFKADGQAKRESWSKVEETANTCLATTLFLLLLFSFHSPRFFLRFFTILLSLSLRKEGRVSVFFPNDKTKRERSFFCSTSATPSFLHLDPGSFFETREISLSSNIRVDRFFFQQFEILKRNKYRNWD